MRKILRGEHGQPDRLVEALTDEPDRWGCVQVEGIRGGVRADRLVDPPVAEAAQEAPVPEEPVARMARKPRRSPK